MNTVWSGAYQAGQLTAKRSQAVGGRSAVADEQRQRHPRDQGDKQSLAQAGPGRRALGSLRGSARRVDLLGGVGDTGRVRIGGPWWRRRDRRPWRRRCGLARLGARLFVGGDSRTGGGQRLRALVTELAVLWQVGIETAEVLAGGRRPGSTAGTVVDLEVGALASGRSIVRRHVAGLRPCARRAGADSRHARLPPTTAPRWPTSDTSGPSVARGVGCRRRVDGAVVGADGCSSARTGPGA